MQTTLKAPLAVSVLLLGLTLAGDAFALRCGTKLVRDGMHEAEILEVMATIDAAGGMYEAVGSGLVQTMIGRSALAAQNRIDSGEEKIVGVNYYQDDDTGFAPPPMRPDAERMRRFVDDFAAFKAARSQSEVDRQIDELRRAAQSDDENVYARVVDAAAAGVTHGEIVAVLRAELGFGDPLIVA